jgi:4-hydroxybenzoate polyprenyltransferase
MTQDNDSHIPLVVDLDGTLFRVDTLHELALNFWLKRPFLSIFLMTYWLLKGLAVLKKELSIRVNLNIFNIPTFEEVILYAKKQKNQGRQVILCTGSDELIAREVVKHFSFFDEFMASDGNINLVAERKRAALELKYGPGGFDYIGNSSADLAVWTSAREAIVVDLTGRLTSKISKSNAHIKTLNVKTPSQSVWLKQLRIHHWVKNLLLFCPIIISEYLYDLETLMQVFLGFLSFSCMASATYVFNDLCDLNADRVHPKKCERAIASGHIPITEAISVGAVLFLIGAMIALSLSQEFFTLFILYTMFTLTYSLYIKKVILFDVFMLASLFTIRVQAGAILVPNQPSEWLLIFSYFTFLSLAFLKRFIELKKTKKTTILGRGYEKKDSPIVLIFGIGSAYSAAMVLSIYLFSEQARTVLEYSKPIFLSVPVFVMWMAHIWMSAYRNKVNYDPLVFAIKDSVSLALATTFLVIFVFAK